MHHGHLVEVLVAHGHVDVAIEEPWEEYLPGHVDALVAIEARPDLDDPSVLDDDVGLGHRRPGPVEYRSAREHRPHGLLRSGAAAQVLISLPWRPGRPDHAELVPLGIGERHERIFRVARSPQEPGSERLDLG